MERKRILIISYFFAPQNQMGAVRPTKLAKYWQRMGHEVTVICGGGMDGKTDPTLARDLQELGDVHQLNEWNPLRRRAIRKEAEPKAAAAPAVSAEEGAKPSKLKTLVMRAMNSAYLWLDWLSDRHFKWLGLRELNRLEGTYDVVFSTYAPVSVHEIARAAKRRGVAGKWFADFRDEIRLPFAFQRGRVNRTLQMIRREADSISAVSQGFLETMQLDDVGRVLSNGYDREDLPVGEPSPTDGCLRLVYCGLFDMGRKGMGSRDLTPAFRALEKLAQDGTIRREQIKLVYAGSEGALMHSYAAACGLEDCVEDHGLVSRKESIRLQKEADILLLASWNIAGQRGILTGKMFEYMMMDKPILCCMNGDQPESTVKRVLVETGLGFCREEANAAADDEQMLGYLRLLIGRWRRGEELLAERNERAVAAYAYPELAAKLVGWLNAADPDEWSDGQ